MNCPALCAQNTGYILKSSFNFHFEVLFSCWRFSWFSWHSRHFSEYYCLDLTLKIEITTKTTPACERLHYITTETVTLPCNNRVPIYWLDPAECLSKRINRYYNIV